MSTILAIDPGNVESAFVVIDGDTRRPVEHGKLDNHELRHRIDWDLGEHPLTAIEMVRSYGMAVGADVFQTCVWIGRFAESVRRYRFDRADPKLVFRGDVKLHHCHTARAKDTNITQALVDRFAPGQPNKGKGTKAEPGWFHGFAADVWQAYALAVYVADAVASDAELEGGLR